MALAKALVDFAKDHPALKFKAGVVSGQDVLDADGVKALSTMPSLPELRSSLLGLLQAPATQLVRLLGTPATQMARVLKAHQEKIEKAVAATAKPTAFGRRFLDERGRRKRWLTFRRSRTT